MSPMKLIFAVAFFVSSAVAHAAPTTVFLVADVFFGDFAGATATGTIVYDDALITGVDDESITAADGLDVEFMLFGQTFTAEDDIDFDGEPSLDFFDGEIVAFDWIVSEVHPFNPTEIDEPGVTDFSMFEVFEFMDAGDLFIEGELFVNDFAVPVPAALPLFVAGLGLLGGLGRRHRA